MALIDIVGGKDEYLRNKVLDHVLGGGDYSRPATVYIALYTALDVNTGIGTEASAGGYARLAVTNNGTNWPAATSGTKRNGTALAWEAATGDVGSIVGAAIFDASSGGNRLYWGPFGTSYSWLAGQPFTIPANAAVFQEY
jgi:hypothetical protein